MRKKERRVPRAIISAVVLVLFFSSGCYSTIALGPMDKEVKLAKKGSMCSEIARKKVWYILYGLVPLGDNTTSDIVQGVEHPVKIEAVTTVVDVLIGIFTSIVTIMPRTIIVYGCR